MVIQDILMAWAKGKAMNAAENGYPHQTPFARYLVAPGDMADKAGAVLPISDERHIIVDGVVSKLGQRKPAHYEIVCLHYLSRLSDRRIARVVGISASSTRNMRENAEYWIEAKLDT